MKNIVGKNVQKIRNKLGITQEQLAIRLEIQGWKVDRFVVSKIERGDRKVVDTEIVIIANALNIMISKLFEDY